MSAELDYLREWSAPGGLVVEGDLPQVIYPSVFVAMAAVMRDIGAVGKSDYNDFQQFNFRGIDSVTNAVYGPMCKHGVFVVPDVVESHYEPVSTSGGKPSRQATLTVRYRFYGPAGDYVDAVTIGEAMDSADKATSKALAAAFKYALLQTFAIPTAGQDDADSSSPQRDAAPEMVTVEQRTDILARLDALGQYPERWQQENLPNRKNMAYMTVSDHAVALAILDEAEQVVGAGGLSEAPASEGSGTAVAPDADSPAPADDPALLEFSDEAM